MYLKHELNIAPAKQEGIRYGVVLTRKVVESSTESEPIRIAR